ncbi:family 2 glycosyl transferase [Calothrix sp. NIES-2100]|uniref:tetratricopeptide repeat protein n=1 Tax=Calothrix sp. NIES-2100 TaxID=1954172 RepID=UPI000B5F9619|nr:family 2 glycosyl transferase [Calothrix sp. NIES-2100]
MVTISSSSTLQVAIKYHQANQLIEAEQSYHQVLVEEPNHPEALYRLGVLAQQKGELESAEKFWNTVVQVQPDFVKAWFSLGNLRLAQQQFSQAVTAYHQALALRRDSIPICNNLGYALQQQGLFDEAINYYQKALELKPDFSEAEANLGNTLHAQGKLSSEQKLHYAKLNNKLGVAHKKAGDLQNAVTYYRQAIALQPDLLEAHYNLGVVLQEQGTLEEAIACYERVQQINPNYGEVYFNLGSIYQKQNQFPKAVGAYRQGLSLVNPHYAKAVAVDDSTYTQLEQATPPITFEEVIVGKNRFPAISPVLASAENRPFWTVVVTVYNRKSYLLECLASVLRQWQGAENMEIIVMDDSSSSSLAELVNSIGGGIVRYYHNQQNLGLPGNWNAGVALSRGQWIHLLHDDDLILPGFYERLQQSLENCPDSVGAAFTGYENINDRGQVIFTQKLYGEYRGIAPNWIEGIGIGNPLNMPAVVIRRATHERLGVYHPELKYTPDWELYKRIAATDDWWCEPEVLARYREHSQNATTELSLAGNQGKDISRAIEISESYLPVEDAANITAKSRSFYWQNFLAQATHLLKIGNVNAAAVKLQEALIVDSSPEAVAQSFIWLTCDEAAPLRDAIAHKLISLPIDFDNN